MDTGLRAPAHRRAARRGAQPHAVARRRLRGRRLRRGRRGGGAGARRHAGAVPLRQRRSTWSPPTSASPTAPTGSSGSSSRPCSTPTAASGTSTPTEPCSASRSASAPSTRRSSGSPSGTGCASATSVRPDFMVLTGNDLAIDMVMYGSDYLLGLSTFAPAEFAARDRCWAEGDVDGFHRRNDVLQWLGTTAFRPPVPAYRHDAALFFQLRGWAESDATPEGAPRRSAWERELLASILDRARGGDLVVRRRDFPQVKNLKRRRRVPRPPRHARHHPPVRRPARPRRARRPDRGRRAHVRQPLLHPPDGGMGRHRRRTPDRPRAPPLVALRHERRRSGLGRRGLRRATRTVGPTPTSSASARSSADDLAELRGLLDPTTRSPASSSPTAAAGRSSRGRRGATRCSTLAAPDPSSPPPSSTTSSATTSPPPAWRATPASTSST